MTEVKTQLGGPTTIRATNALQFFAKNMITNITSDYVLTFDISLKPNLPLHKKITCNLYKKSIKHQNYKKIASRIFVVKQDKENGVLNNSMALGNFDNLKLPDFDKINKFVSETLSHETMSPYKPINGKDTFDFNLN